MNCYPCVSRRQRGFSLLEIIVALAILSVAITSVMSLTMRQVAQDEGRTQVEALGAFQSIAANFVLANRKSFYSATTASEVDDLVRRFCVVKVADITSAILPGDVPGAAGSNGTLMWSDTLKTCAFDATLLKANYVWPINARIDFTDPVVGMGQWRYVAIIRAIRKVGIDGEPDRFGPEIDMLTVPMNLADSMEALPADFAQNNPNWITRIQAAQRVGGSQIGMMPIGDFGFCSGTQSAQEICGQGWKLNLSEFVDEAQLSTLRDVLPE